MELVGRQFGHIRVTGVVGEGGMGAVYAGQDEKLDRKVALKVLHADQRLDVEARERLLREARALSKVDHPNICRIHDYLETGDVDLLVLEYIDGRTLQRAMEDALPYSEKLRIASTIAEVLVRAHRAGIVHRDLKPENVMITKLGEVKVLDFGLARWLTRTRRSSGSQPALDDSGIRVRVRPSDVKNTPAHGETLVMPSVRATDIYPREFLATAAGITLGTPLYMSPEQARGEALTPASDMFSFGLLLQVLFTGKEPHPETITVREVILRAARGETEPAEGAPKAITALINSLKAFAPADRPTAVQTVERLRFLIATPQRIARRTVIGTVAAVMLFGGWRYTVDLDRERTIAVNERAEAQRQKAKAEDLINFMVDDLRVKLEPVGRLEILDNVSEKVLQYVSGLKPETMSSDELARNAKALIQLGEVRVKQGKTSEAMQLFSTSLGLANAAVERDPKNAEAILSLGLSHFSLGDGLRLQGKVDEALHHMREYMVTGDALVSLDPTKKEHQLERAYGHSGVALILENQRKLQQALEHYTIARQVKEELARREPGNSDMQADLARAFNKIGVVLTKLGNLAGARAQFTREVEIYRALVSADEDQMQWKQRLATSMAFLGRSLNDTGNTAEANSLWREELSIERELMAHDPENVEWLRNVAVTLRRIAAAEAGGGSLPAALALSREAVSTIGKAVQMAPDRTPFRIDAAAINIGHAMLLKQSGDLRAARELLRSVAGDLHKLRAKEKRADVYLARAAYELGETYAKSDPTAANAAWEQAEAALAPSITDASDPELLDSWARILLRRGRMAEARTVRTRIQTTGYVSPALERLCTELGC